MFYTSRNIPYLKTNFGWKSLRCSKYLDQMRLEFTQKFMESVAYFIQF
jgi:hypothetical protein